MANSSATVTLGPELQRAVDQLVRDVAGDVVAIRERKQSKLLAEGNLAFPGLANIPPHLELDKNKLTAKVISKCEREWVALEINELLVVEFYSRKV